MYLRLLHKWRQGTPALEKILQNITNLSVVTPEKRHLRRWLTFLHNLLHKKQTIPVLEPHLWKSCSKLSHNNNDR